MSWLKIFVFYCIYYSCLAAFWMACLHVFFAISIEKDRPTYTLGNSLIGEKPGVGLRPRTTDKKIDSSLYYVNLTDKATKTTDDFGEGDLNIDMAKRAELFLNTYKNTTGLQDCTNLAEEKKRDCIFDYATVLDECAQHPYGYVPDANGLAKPCFFIKLNKIFGFVPMAYNKTEQIDKLEVKETLKDEMKRDMNRVFFDCRGRYPADNEGADNKPLDLQYFPSTQSIPLEYFPYLGPPYHSPLVAVRVNNPPVGRLVHLECRVYYNGAKHITKDKVGLNQFELLVDRVPEEK